jgi:hypothetical protein
MDHITPDYVRNLNSYTDSFLCSVTANIYQIKFIKFRVRDLDSETVLFEVEEEKSEETEKNANQVESDEERLIRYHLGPDFLDLKNLGTQLTFTVGDKPVKNLLMVERHYFKDKLIKSFEFSFDFCIPNSTNEWETLYTIPSIDEELKEQMINSPWETKSDSFYFVEGKLVMHHKAIYNYSYSD